MTTLAEKIAVMQAFERREAVECRLHGSKHWITADDPMWNWSEREYRVSPKPIDLVEVLTSMRHLIKEVDDDGYEVGEALMGHTWADIIARAKELQG